MSITTSAYNDRRLTTFTVIGEVSFEEGMSALKQFWKGQPTMNALWDLRMGRTSDLYSDDLKKIADYYQVSFRQTLRR